LVWGDSEKKTLNPLYESRNQDKNIESEKKSLVVYSDSEPS